MRFVQLGVVLSLVCKLQAAVDPKDHPQLDKIPSLLSEVRPRFCGDCLELCLDPSSEFPQSPKYWWRDWATYNEMLDAIEKMRPHDPSECPELCTAALQEHLEQKLESKWRSAMYSPAWTGRKEYRVNRKFRGTNHPAARVDAFREAFRTEWRKMEHQRKRETCDPKDVPSGDPGPRYPRWPNAEGRVYWKEGEKMRNERADREEVPTPRYYEERPKDSLPALNPLADDRRRHGSVKPERKVLLPGLLSGTGGTGGGTGVLGPQPEKLGAPRARAAEINNQITTQPDFLRWQSCMQRCIMGNMQGSSSNIIGKISRSFSGCTSITECGNPFSGVTLIQAGQKVILDHSMQIEEVSKHNLPRSVAMSLLYVLSAAAAAAAGPVKISPF